MKPVWEMTIDEWEAAQREYILSRWPNTSEKQITDTIRRNWHNLYYSVLLRRSYEVRIADRVLDSLVARYGDGILRDFRGTNEQAGYLLPSVRCVGA